MYKDVLRISFPVYSWFLGYHVPWSNLFTSQLQKNKKQVVYTLGSLQLIIHVSFLNISLFLHRILIYFRMIRALMSLQRFCFSGPTSWCWWLVPHQPITWKLFARHFRHVRHVQTTWTRAGSHKPFENRLIYKFADVKNHFQVTCDARG